MPHMTSQAYHNLSIFYGDIHNHCDLSYGHGSLADALYNARLQLDFVSVVVHAVWPDLPKDDAKLAYLIDYHEKGFAKAQANWAVYLHDIDHANEDGDFVTFPAFEWHSIEYGDYCIYYPYVQDDMPIIDAPDLASLRAELRKLSYPTFLIPHHIGYRQGSRGINWQSFTDEMSPIAEIFSFHGLSESSEGPYPYLHSMGPRHEQSTAQYGWEQGNLFGVVGSTDHHNAFPGSYGYGRMGVWAESCSREAIWEAIQKRRTYALTGDRINLQFSLNETAMGGICASDDTRAISVDVVGGDCIDYIDVLHNNCIIHRESIVPKSATEGRFKVYIEMGWGEQAEAFDWDVSLAIENGTLHEIEPRLRGISPTEGNHKGDFAYTSLEHDGNDVHLKTKTLPNLSLHTPCTEGFVVELDGTPDTMITLTINGQVEQVCLHDILTGSRAFYTGGFVSPVLCVHQAVPQSDYHHHFTLTHQHDTSQCDWYYVRVRQRNNQWAWSSPIWVDGKST